MDIKKLREMQKRIENKSGKGDDKMFVYSNKLSEEDNIRLLEPHPNLNGLYFVEQEVWWIKGKMYLSNSTYGEKDVIQEEVDLAKAQKDKDLDALLSAKENKNGQMVPVIKKETRYLIAILHLLVKYDDDDNMESCDVIDDMGKVLIAKPSLMNEINTIVTSRQIVGATKGTEHGAADRVKGFNMVVSKKGSGLNTEYGALAWLEPMEMPAKYYEKPIDIQDMTDKMRKEDEYLRSVIRNYLYGEEIIADVNAKSSNTDAAETTKSEAKPAPTAGGSKRPTAAAKKEDEVEKPKRLTRPTAAGGGAAKERSLTDDLLSDDAVGDID